MARHLCARSGQRTVLDKERPAQAGFCKERPAQAITVRLSISAEASVLSRAVTLPKIEKSATSSILRPRSQRGDVFQWRADAEAYQVAP